MKSVDKIRAFAHSPTMREQLQQFRDLQPSAKLLKRNPYPASLELPAFMLVRAQTRDLAWELGNKHRDEDPIIDACMNELQNIHFQARVCQTDARIDDAYEDKSYQLLVALSGHPDARAALEDILARENKIKRRMKSLRHQAKHPQAN